MTNVKASRYLKHIMAFKEAILLNKKELEIIGYRKKEKIEVNSELKAFIDVVDKLKSEIKDKEILKIFKLCYELNLKDIETLNFIHMSASTFYRTKNYICEKVILLCTARGLVSETEILKSINEILI